MNLTINQLHPLYAAEINGIDIKTADPELLKTIEQAVAAYAMVVIRNQFITDEEQITFSRKFGPLELPPDMGIRSGQQLPRRIAPQMYDVSNLDPKGDFLPPGDLRHLSNRANEEFHTDSSFNALPTKWSLLSARIVPPEGGDTLYVDTRAAYEALPNFLKDKAKDAVAEHYFWKTRGRAGYQVTDAMEKAMPPVQHPVVRVIPDSGRTALYIGNHATHIVGWPEETGEKFLQDLNDFATQPQFIYAHKWREGDFVIWDNRCTLHRATQYDVFKYKRDLRRTTINESGPEISSTGMIRAAATG